MRKRGNRRFFIDFMSSSRLFRLPFSLRTGELGREVGALLLAGQLGALELAQNGARELYEVKGRNKALENAPKRPFPIVFPWISDGFHRFS